LTFAVQRTVDTYHWSYTYKGALPVSSDTSDSDDDEDPSVNASCKKQRISVVPKLAEHATTNTVAPKEGTVAGGEDLHNEGVCCLICI
jgi:hypothetical protein